MMSHHQGKETRYYTFLCLLTAKKYCALQLTFIFEVLLSAFIRTKIIKMQYLKDLHYAI